MTVSQLIENLQQMSKYDRDISDVVLEATERMGELVAIYLESESVCGGADVCNCILSTDTKRIEIKPKRCGEYTLEVISKDTGST